AWLPWPDHNGTRLQLWVQVLTGGGYIRLILLPIEDEERAAMVRRGDPKWESAFWHWSGEPFPQGPGRDVWPFSRRWGIKAWLEGPGFASYFPASLPMAAFALTTLTWSWRRWRRAT